MPISPKRKFLIFILQLVSSWAVNPIAMGIAILMGISQSPIIYVQFIFLGIAFPFQLFLNECAASSLHMHKIIEFRSIVLIAIFFLFLSLLYNAFYINYLDKDELGIISISTIIIIIISFISAIEYVRLIHSGFLSHINAIAIGITPGLTLTINYMLVATFTHKDNLNSILIATQTFPAIAQLFLVKLISARIGDSVKQMKMGRFIVTKQILINTLISLGGLVIVSGTIGILRDKISGGPGKYSALFLLFLNMTTSVLMLFTKGDLNVERINRNFNIFLSLGIGFLLLGIVINFGKYSIYSNLLSIQFILIALIDHGRIIFIPNEKYKK